MTIKEKAAAMKLDSTLMASKPAEMRNRALAEIIKAQSMKIKRLIEDFSCK